MRLANDAFEGKEAKTITEAQRGAKSLATNAASLRSQFGLAHAEHAAPGPAEVLPAALRQQFDTVFTGYFAVGGALAGDDAAGAAEGLKDLSAAVAKVDMSLLRGAAREAWTRHEAALTDILAKAADAADLQKLRELLAPLSDEMASLARRFPPDRKHAYFLLHCPMAFEGRGAVWLQDSQQVRNPYFGSGMLECGEVQEMIRGEDTPAPAAPGSAPGHEHD